MPSRQNLSADGFRGTGNAVAAGLDKIRNFIGGQFVAPPIGGKYLENVEPATGHAYSLVPDSDRRDVEQAVAAADNAFPDLVAHAGGGTFADSFSAWRS